MSFFSDLGFLIIMFAIIGIGMYFVNEFPWVCCLIFSGFCFYCIYRFITEVIL